MDLSIILQVVVQVSQELLQIRQLGQATWFWPSWAAVIPRRSEQATMRYSDSAATSHGLWKVSLDAKN